MSAQLDRYLLARFADGLPRDDAAFEAGFSIEEARLTDIAVEKGDIAAPAPWPLNHNQPEESPMSEGTIAADELRLLIERVERLEEEKKAIADDIKDVYAEAKARGYDTKTMREIVKLRKMETHERQEREALLETYKAALGMDYSETPLGQATIRSAAERAVAAVNSGALGPGVTAELVKQAEEDPPAQYREAVTLVREHGSASTSWLQRQLGIGFNQAAGIIEQMQAEGVVTAPDDTGRRKVVATVKEAAEA